MEKSTSKDDILERVERLEHDMAHIAWRVERLERLEHDMQRMAYYDAVERSIERRRRKKT